ncbi:hypothetical protein BASA61_008920 [Batrachochytrium salamandrivorans]|nr:hypothetical protein BASA61_008920 [Batrachochytrium salamandrivorans]
MLTPALQIQCPRAGNALHVLTLDGNDRTLGPSTQRVTYEPNRSWIYDCAKLKPAWIVLRCCTIVYCSDAASNSHRKQGFTDWHNTKTSKQGCQYTKCKNNQPTKIVT